MRRKAVGVVVVAAVLIVAAVPYRTLWPYTYRVADILAAYQPDADYSAITLECPLDGTLFPPELFPPMFRWKDNDPASAAWLVRIEFADGRPEVQALTRRRQWTPRPQDWEDIKRRALQREARVVILGVSPGRPVRIRSHVRLSFRTSKDPVAAPLFYREVNLPFLEADQDPSRIRWRFGSIASPPPPIVLKNLRVCGNCHSFSADGSMLVMDVDYANDKGSYVITAVQEQMVLATRDIITWESYRTDDGAPTFGLLSQISPDGHYVVSTVMLLQPDSPSILRLHAVVPHAH